MNYKLWLIIFLTGIFVLFIAQNIAVVEIQFIFWSAQLPRSFLMISLLIIGVIIGWLLHGYTSHHKKPNK